MSLSDIQSSFIDYLLDPGSVDNNFSSFLSNDITLKPDSQKEIYLRSINGSHQNSLAIIFNACHNILGEQYFNQLCREFRKIYPSTLPDFNQYGSSFPGFLQEKVRDNRELKEFSYLSELTEFELHWHYAFFENSTSTFNHDSLQLLTEEELQQLVFTLPPSIYFNETDLPILDIWEANRNTSDSNQGFNIPDETVYYCIYNNNSLPELAQISRQDYDLFTALCKNMDINSITTSFQHEHCPVPEFIQNGWINGFYLESC